MTEIGSGGNYRISVSALKNRLYFRFFGDILRVEDNPQVVDHFEEAMRCLKPGFTVLSDNMELKMLGLPDMAQLLQTSLVDAGVSRVAMVWSAESFSKLVLDSSAQKLGDAYSEKRRSFTNPAEAEAWLDGDG